MDHRVDGSGRAEGECALANDPFFLPGKVKQNFKVPKHVKYEVRADIPYKNDTISIASYDTHGDFLQRPLTLD